MASPKKKTPKAKTKGAAPAKGKSGGFKYKKYILLAVAAYALIFLGINYQIFVKNDVKKEVACQTLGQFNGLGKPCGALAPQDITALGNDKLALTDRNTRRILIFQRDGTLVRTLEENKKADPKDNHKFTGISSDAKGNLYVIDDNNNTIRAIGQDGTNILSLSLQPFGCYVPRQVYWTGNLFFLADTGGQRILKISPTGELLDHWGSHGDCKECFDNPYQAVGDPLNASNFYVPDYDNKRVKYMNDSGKVLKVIKLPARPNAVAVDAQGDLFVASTEGSFVREYGPSGGAYKGDLKDTKGQDNFAGVNGISAAPDGTLLLAESEGVALVKVTQTP